MKKIKILFIVPNMQQGGLENYIMNIIRNSPNYFEFSFLVHYKKKYFFDEELEKRGISIHRLSIREDKNFFKYLKNLKDFFKTHNNYDVVHTHMLSLAFIELKYAKKYGRCKNRIAHSHNSSTAKSFKGFIKWLLIKLSSKYATKLISCSDESGKFAFGHREFIVKKNGIDYERFTFNTEKRIKYRNDLNLKKNDILIGNIGRFNIQKNQIFLLKMFVELKSINPSYKLLLIGDGELKDKIDSFISKNHIEGVIILNNISNVEDYYSTMDVFALPSLFEGLPLTSIEAQVSGLPCLFLNSITSEAIISKKIYLMNTKSFTYNNLVAINSFIISSLKEKRIEVFDNSFDLRITCHDMETFYLSLIEKV